MAAAKPTLGSLADKVKGIANQRAELSAKDKVLKAQQDELEAQLMKLMDELDTRTGEGKVAKVSINESVVPTVKDWDTFFKWATRTKNTHLIPHHISAPSWREMVELKKADVPGIEPFTKRTLSIRAV